MQNIHSKDEDEDERDIVPAKAGFFGMCRRADCPLGGIVVAMLAPFAALGVQWLLWDYFQPYVWFLFFPAAFFSAWAGGLIGGISATLTSALLVWYFFIPPSMSFALKEPSSAYSVIIFAVMGCLFALFHNRLRDSLQRTDKALEDARAAKDEMTRLYNKELQAAEQKRQFFSRISHELRTPLTLVIAPMERRLEEDLSVADRRETELMHRNARLLQNYVVNLLDVARIEAGQLQLSCTLIDMALLTRAMASHFESLASSRGIEYKVDVPESLPAELDGEKMQRILVDLLANAFRFTPDGGKIEVRASQHGDFVEIEVQDSGPRIPGDLRSAVFERFPSIGEEMVRRQGGAGLSLSIVKDFVELQGGTITLDEAPHRGALFSVRLPRKAATGSVTGASFTPDEALAQQAVRSIAFGVPRATPEPELVRDGQAPLILVVEDDPDMNEFITSSLDPYYRVCSAFNGREGLDKATELLPDLIVTDLMMPEMSGEEMVAMLRRQPATGNLPIVVISARADEETRLHLLSDGVQEYLSKPFSTQELLARVGGMVKSRQRTLAELARSAARLRRLAEVVEQVAAIHDLPGLMAIIRSAVRELTGADGATLVMREGGYCHYVDEDAIGPLWKGQRFPLETCISGWTMLHAEAVVIEDIYADPRIPYAAYRTTFVKSLSMVPIGRVSPVGAVGCYWSRRHSASSEELELQQALADAMSVGLANLELYGGLLRRNEELERFNQASIGREMEMIKLKQQVNELSVRVGLEPPYSLAFLDEPVATVTKAEQ